jgi:hypothetical protein
LLHFNVTIFEHIIQQQLTAIFGRKSRQELMKVVPTVNEDVLEQYDVAIIQKDG